MELLSLFLVFIQCPAYILWIYLIFILPRIVGWCVNLWNGWAAIGEYWFQKKQKINDDHSFGIGYTIIQLTIAYFI